MSNLDDIEKQIVLQLQQDGRMPTAELARRLDVSEPTVRKKLSRLLADGVIRIAAIANPLRLGFSAPAFIGLDVDRDKIKTVAAALCTNPLVSNVAVTTGPYDIMIEAAFKSNSELYNFVLNELAKVEGIRDSHSFIILERFKQDVLQGIADSYEN